MDQAPEPAAPMDQLRQDPDPPEALQCHVAGFGRAKPCVTMDKGAEMKMQISILFRVSKTTSSQAQIHSP